MFILRLISILYFLLFSNCLLFGITSVDSLKTLLNQKKGEEKFQILEKLSNYYSRNNLDSSYYFLIQLKNSAIKSHNIKYEAIAYSSLAMNAFYKGDSFEAEDLITRAIEIHIQVKDSVNLADSYNILAGIYGSNGHYLKSIKYLKEAIYIFESREDLLSMVAAYNNLGFLNMSLENYTRAINYYKEAISTIDINNFKNHKGHLYNNLGICYKNIEQYDIALSYYKKALDEYRKYNLKSDIPSLYLNFANIYGFRYSELDSALFYYKNGIDLAKKDDVNSLVGLYNSFGQFLYEHNQYEKGINNLLKASSIAENNGDIKGQMEAHENLAEVNKIINKYQQALSHYEQYVALKDSTEVKETKVTIAQLEEKFENEKNRITIQKLEIKQEADKQLRIFMISGIIFLLIVLFFIIYALFQRKKRHKLAQKLLNAEREKIEDELNFSNKQLASQALMMMQKNSMLQTMHESIGLAQKEPPEKLHYFLRTFKAQINRNLKTEQDWELFKLYFEQVNKTFFQKLKIINSNLTYRDIRLAALIKLRFDIKEAAAILNLSPNSVKGARSRLRAKLNMNSSDDLAHFIENIE